MKNKRKVMVVDDAAPYLAWMKMALEKAGYAVGTWQGSKGVAEALRSQKPDILLLDIEMPGIQGDEVALSLRAEFGDELKIILCSALPEAELANRARAAGASGYISKSHDYSDILRQVRNYLSGDILSNKTRVLIGGSPSSTATIFAQEILADYPDLHVEFTRSDAAAAARLQSVDDIRFVLLAGKKQDAILGPKTLAAAKKAGAVPVIYFGAEWDIDTLREVTQAGVTHFLAAPLSEESLRVGINYILDAPEPSRNVALRVREARIKAPVRLQVGDGELISAITSDVRESGAFVFTGDILPVGAKVGVALELPGTSGLIELSGTVLFSRPRTLGFFPMGMAISFSGSDAAKLRLLREALTRI
ncbi:response regulator [Myxococcota bacterium]|nr:response regulator [Myxococcota bacterium]